MQFSNKDHVMMKDGTAFVGSVTTKFFTIRLYESADISFKRDNIIHIITKNSGMGTDEILLKDSSRVNGSIIESTLEIELTDGQPLKLPFSKILAIQFLSNL